jgi:hypothetical protein
MLLLLLLLESPALAFCLFIWNFFVLEKLIAAALLLES